ncbi:MAG: pantoate--beta-alanine ligase [Alphaproteobacteria bacterium]|nr:pantoate--beta-alanine ligase [Alphaproteobacteria bacterium]MBV9539970.1 pantoate--beta-alanine ligase [Alphaproteobacteria bacterium]
MTPNIVHTIADLRKHVTAWRASGLRIGLVPTMGALHDGHLSLVRQTQTHANKTVVSIFVNPTQFAPHEDFDRYPRTLDTDAQKLAGVGLDLIFAPSVAEMYPAGFATKIEVSGPSMGLETDFRPHFFGGVATVVAKLLTAVWPDMAIFGEKDYQQLLVIRRLATDLNLPVEITGAPIVREPDGLAMSSRNAYLNPQERAVAGKLNLILNDAASRAKTGNPIATAEGQAADALLKAGFDSVDYVAIRDASTLQPLDKLNRPARILAAAKIGATRLIDNLPV